MCAASAKATAHRIISDINVLEGESEIDRRGAFHRGGAEKKVFLPRINANERGSGEIAKNWPNLKNQIFETRRNGGSGGQRGKMQDFIADSRGSKPGNDKSRNSREGARRGESKSLPLIERIESKPGRTCL